jgi:hypothetical protein
MNNTGTFSAAGDVSSTLSLAANESVEIILTNSGGHAWRVDLEQLTKGNSAYKSLQQFSSDTATTLYANTTGKPLQLRLRFVTVNSSDTVAYTFRDTVPVASKALVVVSGGKVGTTAGWVVGAANNLGKLATLPLNITAGTLVVPIPRLSVGDRIVGAYLVGSLQAASAKASSISLDVRKLVAATSGATDSSVVAMSTALSVTADTIVSKANTQIQCSEPVAEGVSYYALITATTFNDALSTQQLLAVVLQIVPA